MTDVQRLDIEGNSKLDELTFLCSQNLDVQKNKASILMLSEHTRPN